MGGVWVGSGLGGVWVWMGVRFGWGVGGVRFGWGVGVGVGQVWVGCEWGQVWVVSVFWCRVRVGVSQMWGLELGSGREKEGGEFGGESE